MSLTPITCSTGVTASVADIATTHHTLTVLDRLLQDEIVELAQQGDLWGCDVRHNLIEMIGEIREALDGDRA